MTSLDKWTSTESLPPGPRVQNSFSRGALASRCLELRSQVTSLQKRVKAVEKAAREQSAEKESALEALTAQLEEKSRHVQALQHDMSTGARKEPYITINEPYITWIESFMTVNEPYIPRKKPYITINEPCMPRQKT